MISVNLGSLKADGMVESNEQKGDSRLAEMSKAHEIDVDKLLEQQMTPSTKVEQPATVEEIQTMIAQLSVTEDGEPLKDAMIELKKAIKANPAACTVLLPEDIGEMVKALYRLTDRDLEQAVAKANKKGKKDKIDLSDPKIQQEILDDL